MLLEVVDAESSDAAQIASILARLDALEAETDATINGLASVEVFGSLESGLVQIQLEGDTDTPGNTYYYGTGPDGTKGWSTVESALDVASGELTKTVGSDGVTTFGLDDTAVTPGSYSSADITVDAKGRITAAASGSGGGGSVFAEASESWDFIKQGVLTSTASGTAFLTNNSVPTVYHAGAGSGASLSSATGAPGIAVLTTGTTTTGYARLFFCPPVVLLGGGEIAYESRFRIPVLSDGTNRFTIGIVMGNVISGAGLQRIGALYIDSTNSGQWVAEAIDGVGTSQTNTTVAPAANTWIVMEIRPNAAGTSFELFIGPDSGSLTSAGTVSANIPAVALGLSVQITKALGTTARTVEVDLATFNQSFTTSR